MIRPKNLHTISLYKSYAAYFKYIVIKRVPHMVQTVNYVKEESNKGKNGTYANGLSSAMGVVATDPDLDRPASSKFCIELDLEDTLVLTFSYADPTLSSIDLKESECLI
uniref:Uncharacterized protein n=1 Tax=Photinus pyralis TaxID=7054 RepID=A0A1Y1LFJ5_PHOPY